MCKLAYGKLVADLAEILQQNFLCQKANWCHKWSLYVQPFCSTKNSTKIHDGFMPTCSLIQELGRLRSAARGQLDVLRQTLSTYGRRAFPYAGPLAWNSLPNYLKDGSLTLVTYKRSLKTFVFKILTHQVHQRCRHVSALQKFTFTLHLHFQLIRGACPSRVLMLKYCLIYIRQMVTFVIHGTSNLAMALLPLESLHSKNGHTSFFNMCKIMFTKNGISVFGRLLSLTPQRPHDHLFVHTASRQILVLLRGSSVEIQLGYDDV